MTKFDFENAIIADGFANTGEYEFESDPSYVKRTYSKTFTKVQEVAWYGEREYSFRADIQILYHDGKPCFVDAYYDFERGPRTYDYNKRAYNAIKDTIRNHGFDIAYTA